MTGPLIWRCKTNNTKSVSTTQQTRPYNTTVHLLVWQSVTVPAVQPPYTSVWKSHLALLGIQALEKEMVRWAMNTWECLLFVSTGCLSSGTYSQSFWTLVCRETCLPGSGWPGGCDQTESEEEIQQEWCLSKETRECWIKLQLMLTAYI